MPLDPSSPFRRRIAVIGGGISGMGAAHFLADAAEVTLFEAGPRLGGHARTVMAGQGGQQPVDTGFIVFNHANYPRLSALFQQLGVPVAPSNMSFAASLRGGEMEYGLENLKAVFSQRRNMFNPKFLGMIRDILRFNARALDAASDRHQPLGDFLEQMQLGDWFRDYYLLPLSGAIWSTPPEQIMRFPARALIQFFENHALLHHSGQHQWYTVQGGSVEYVRRLEASLRRRLVDLRIGAPVRAVRRFSDHVELRVAGGGWEVFDELVLATHSDDSLALLADPATEEARALGAIGYQPNEITLHADPRAMPRRRGCWSSWNYTEGRSARDGKIDLTYWMNKLQPIPANDPMFVTLNARKPIRDELIYDQVTLRHPVYDQAALRAQGEVAGFNGARRTWFCGAWMRNGFHEDGLASAADVADRILARPDVMVAAE
ncbi:NAD(P)/FAD-dependent oxidoreductase [Marinovum algicola]|jgi:predicted NAD/FAD-binding protein|uniref:NAD(P)/FAD-dependent oxidoreductase n=1 Tax=Marinovum algicola TaxID=42444 RepID=UPI0024BB9F23|nr:FAD-dependent oxidoreductase [Marinovum algicola]